MEAYLYEGPEVGIYSEKFIPHIPIWDPRVEVLTDRQSRGARHYRANLLALRITLSCTHFKGDSIDVRLQGELGDINAFREMVETENSRLLREQR